MPRMPYHPHPKYPAIIFNESGSMRAPGRMEKSMELIMNLSYETPVDFYINSADTGYPRFISHLGRLWSSAQKTYQPLLPIPSGEDYMSILALASLIEEYPEGVHLIDDGDSITGWVSEALHLLKSMKSPGYMHPVTVYMVRGAKSLKMVESYYEHFMKELPADEGFNVQFYFAVTETTFDSSTYPGDKVSFK